MTIRVLIVESNPQIATHTQNILVLVPDFEVVGVVSEVTYTMFNTTSRLQPDVILVAIIPADDEIFDRVRQLVKHFPAVAVVMMSPQSDSETLNRAMLAGARDVLEIPLDTEKLYETVRRVYDSFASIRASYATTTAAKIIDVPSHSATPKLNEAEEQSKKEAISDLDDMLILPPPSPPKPITSPPSLTDDDEFIDKESVDWSDNPSPEPESPMIPPPQPAPIVMPSPIPRPSRPIKPITPPAVELPELVPVPEPVLEKVITLKPTLFSTYYPREAQANRKNGLYVYAHLEDALAAIRKDVEKFKEELGGAIPQPRTAKQSAQIAENTPITIIPESDTLQFEPESLTKRWRESFTRFDFDFFPSANLVDETAFVRVSVQVGGIEIASIKCGIEVVESKATPIAQPIADENPLASARFATQQAETYRKIFISYSRKDSQVARAYQMAQVAMGNEVFLDVDSLRAGENWQAALARAIDSADIFQMFWSSSYAESDYCRYEWDYALRYRCPDQKCEGFIRPVYWVNPMSVTPPAELGHLNFKYVPFNAET
jgi:DNA-binding NarL/FixJ family response regulator